MPFCFIYKLLGLIAQWIEHPPSKRVVVGSNPTQSDSTKIPLFIGGKLGLNHQFIPYQDGEKQLEGFFAYQHPEKRPLVLLCHAWKGRDEFICEKATQIAALGYSAFALDMYGNGVLGNSREENRALKQPFIENRRLLQTRVLKGFDSALALPYVDMSRIAVLGFGFGGLCALDLARTGAALKGAVSIYGHFDPPQNCPQQRIKAKILILHGYNDPISPISELEHFQQELTREDVDWQTHLYGNTFHAFATPSANDPVAGIVYQPLSAARAWEQVERFFAEIFT